VNEDHPQKRVEIDRRAVPGPAGELAVLEAGEGGLPVLFVHGLAGRAEQWLALLEHLASPGDGPGRRCAAVTLRGHGTSGFAPGSPLDPEALAGDVEAAASAVGFGPFVLVGHSLGAAVAVAAAARWPERVRGLFLVDPNGDLTAAPEEQVRTYLAAIRADPAGEVAFQFEHILLDARPEVSEVIRDDLATVLPEVLAGALEGAARYPVAQALASYPGPRCSLITPLNNLPVSLHKRVPDLPVEILLGTSHWPMLDQPETVAAYLDLFLAGL